MNSNEKGVLPRSYSYPGTFREYSRQALVSSVVFGAVLCFVVLAVSIFDRLFYGSVHLTWWHLAGLTLILAGFLMVAQFMAFSLSRFKIREERGGLIIIRAGNETRVSFDEISGLDRIRIPGWWPLRADLKTRGETARRMIRIKRGQDAPVTFISGLENEKELIQRIIRSASIGEKNENNRT